MPTWIEVVLKRTAGLAALLTVLSLVLGRVGPWADGWPAWIALAFLYLTGVAYGLGEMTRLYHRHRRRCRTCLEGARPHLLWWLPRVVLVLIVSVLPVLLLTPAVTGSGG